MVDNDNIVRWFNKNKLLPLYLKNWLVKNVQKFYHKTAFSTKFLLDYLIAKILNTVIQNNYN